MKERFNLFNKLYSSVFLFLAMISSAFAAMPNPFESLQDIMGYVFEFGSLSWIGAAQRVYAVKFIYFIVIIVLIEYFLRHPREIIKDKKVRGVIAFAVAAIATLFIPSDLAEIAGGQYGMLFGLILAGSLPGLLIWQGWKALKDDPDTAGKKWKQVFILFLGINLLSTIGGMFDLSGHDGNFVSSASSMIMAGLGIAFFIYLISAVMKTFGHKVAGGEVAQAGTDIGKSINKASGAIGAGVASMKEAYKNAKKKRLEEIAQEKRERRTLHSIKKDLKNVKEDLAEIFGLKPGVTNIQKIKARKKLQSVLNDISRRLQALIRQETLERRSNQERENAEDQIREEESNEEIQNEQVHERDLQEETRELNTLQKNLSELFNDINGYFQRGGINSAKEIKRLIDLALAEVESLENIVNREITENRVRE